MKARYVYKISAFLLGIILMASCASFEDFEPISLDPAPTVSVALVSAADSSVTVGVTSNADGYVSAVLLQGTGNPVPDSAALLTENIIYDEFGYEEVEANVAANFTFTSVVQDADYEIMAVAANADGVVSEVAVLEVSSTDSYPPQLLSSTPGSTYGYALDPMVPLVLTFDEPVSLGTGGFTFEVPFGGPTIPVPADSVAVSGNEVWISMPPGYIHGDYMWLHMDAAAVVDAAGNEVAELTTFYDADNNAFVGLFWSVVTIPMDVQGVSPDVATPQNPGFDITLTFSDAISYDGSDGDLTLIYTDTATNIVTTIPLTAADITENGTELIITQGGFSPANGTVTLHVPEAALSVYWDNPVNEISETWEFVPAVK